MFTRILCKRKKKTEDAFYIADLGSIVKQHQKWQNQLPNFTPFYAVKCNNDINVLRTLVSLGTNFDCASMEEIKTMIGLGVAGNRIIYANPCKQPNHIKFAYENGIERMTFDNEEELLKIKENHHNAKLVMRVHVDDSKSICQLGIKFGVRLGNTKALLEVAKNLDLNVVGVSFHVGSGCTDANAYNDAIKRAKDVFIEAEEVGFNLTLLDIGGGFPGFSGIQNGIEIEFEEITKVINTAIDTYFPTSNIEMIAEPGRFYVASAFLLATNITSRRTILDEKQNKSFMYYVNDGVYGSFNCLIFDHSILPQPEFMVKSQKTGKMIHLKDESVTAQYDCSIWGPTCDSMDCLTKSMKIPELSVGDWLIFGNMGAYTLVAASKFNGMKKPTVYYLNSDINISLLKPSYNTCRVDEIRAAKCDEDFDS